MSGADHAFFLFLCKGLLLGCFLALFLPVAGISTKNNGLVPWLYIAAGLLALLLLLQYLETIHVLRWALLHSLIAINSQVILVEGAGVGFLLLTGLINRKK